MMSPIPCYQTLGPRSGWNAPHTRLHPYPLSHARIRKYYLGRNAIFHGARALGLSAGGEVLFPAYHSGTESAALLHLGCKLTFYGVDRNLDVDLNEVEARIGSNTKALYAIHFMGFPCPIERMREIADRHNLLLIEDVALSFLSQTGGRALGTWGDISIFCLHKTLPVAAGAVLAINREDILLPEVPKQRSLYSELNLTSKHLLDYLGLHGGRAGSHARTWAHRFFGHAVSRTKLKVRSPDALAFNPSLLNWGMGPITKRLLCYFDYEQIAERRRQNYQWLAGQLRGTDVAMLRETLPDQAVPLFFPILVEDKFGTVEDLWRDGIQAVRFWGIHHEHLPRGEFPETEFLVDHVVEIPIYQELSLHHLQRIADALVKRAAWPEYQTTMPASDINGARRALRTPLGLPQGFNGFCTTPPRSIHQCNSR